MCRWIVVVLSLLILISCSRSNMEKTVFLAILARNKAHTLPKYLKTIENLEYDKKAITIYINTNNNRDETEEILRKWVEKHRGEYRDILFESHAIDALEGDQTAPHAWDQTRFRVLANIRNHSLQKAIEAGTDYYFVIDCDIFVTPGILKTLISKQKPMIAPMMRTYPANLAASTYWCDFDENGFYKDNPFYYEILNQTVRGTFPVPLVHCVYLIESQHLPKLDYLDETMPCEFIAFSQSARRAGVQQYICNEEDFGFVYFEDHHISLEEEKESFQQLFGEAL